MNDQRSKIYDAHCQEADDNGAEFYNLGWAQGEDFIHSKTDKGRLFTEMQADGSITHEWQKGPWN